MIAFTFHIEVGFFILPVNPPTGGWQVLENNPDAVAVKYTWYGGGISSQFLILLALKIFEG